MSPQPDLPFDLADPATFLDLGNRLVYENGRLADAEKAFQAALDLDEKILQARLGLALVYCLQNRYAEEIAILQTALDRAAGDDERAEIHLRLGIAYDLQRDKPKAQTELQILRNLDPERAGLLEEIMKLE